MATTTTTATQVLPPQTVMSAPVEIADAVDETAPEWLKRFATKGWTVVGEVIPQDKALEYADKGYQWLESWKGLGFDRNDPSTRNAAHLPWSTRGGLYNRYGIGHEQFVWDLKSEPGLVDKFARLWGTEELLVSFDGLNLSLPAAPTTDAALFKPWSHVDQSPHVARFDCVQGILNLLPNGPDDGGLMVLDGSAAHYAELWEHFDHKRPAGGWNTRAWQDVDADMCDWLIKAKGCRWVKVCAQPGDLMLWDSRTVHYGTPPSSTNPRFAAYVCYKPASMVDDDVKRELREAFAKRQSTSHDPSCFRAKERLPPKEHHSYEEASRRTLQEPVLSPRGRQLAGLDPY